MSEGVFYEIGVIGTTLFSTITALALISMYGGTTLNVKLSFGFMAMMGVLEIPRYVVLTIYKNYSTNAQVPYAFHLESSVFYFLCISTISLILDETVNFTKPVRHIHNVNYTTFFGRILDHIYSKKILFMVIVVFFGLNVGAIVEILVASSLHNGQRSNYFIFYTGVDASTNFFYSTSIYIAAISTSKRIDGLAEGSPRSGASASANPVKYVALLLLAGRKLKLTAFACLFASAIRVFMLILKVCTYQSDTADLPEYLPVFGLSWWIMADFIPRCLPTFTILYVFGVGNMVSRFVKECTIKCDVRGISGENKDGTGTELTTRTGNSSDVVNPMSKHSSMRTDASVVTSENSVANEDLPINEDIYHAMLIRGISFSFKETDRDSFTGFSTTRVSDA